MVLHYCKIPSISDVGLLYLPNFVETSCSYPQPIGVSGYGFKQVESCHSITRQGILWAMYWPGSCMQLASGMVLYLPSIKSRGFRLDSLTFTPCCALNTSFSSRAKSCLPCFTCPPPFLFNLFSSVYHLCSFHLFYLFHIKFIFADVADLTATNIPQWPRPVFPRQP